LRTKHTKRVSYSVDWNRFNVSIVRSLWSRKVGVSDISNDDLTSTFFDTVGLIEDLTQCCPIPNLVDCYVTH